MGAPEHVAVLRILVAKAVPARKRSCESARSVQNPETRRDCDPALAADPRGMAGHRAGQAQVLAQRVVPSVDDGRICVVAHPRRTIGEERTQVTGKGFEALGLPLNGCAVEVSAFVDSDGYRRVSFARGRRDWSRRRTMPSGVRAQVRQRPMDQTSRIRMPPH